MSIVVCELEYNAIAMQSLYVPVSPVVQNYRIGQYLEGGKSLENNKRGA